MVLGVFSARICFEFVLICKHWAVIIAAMASGPATLQLRDFVIMMLLASCQPSATGSTQPSRHHITGYGMLGIMLSSSTPLLQHSRGQPCALHACIIRDSTSPRKDDTCRLQHVAQLTPLQGSLVLSTQQLLQTLSSSSTTDTDVTLNKQPNGTATNKQEPTQGSSPKPVTDAQPAARVTLRMSAACSASSNHTVPGNSSAGSFGQPNPPNTAEPAADQNQSQLQHEVVAQDIQEQQQIWTDSVIVTLASEDQPEQPGWIVAAPLATLKHSKRGMAKFKSSSEEIQQAAESFSSARSSSSSVGNRLTIVELVLPLAEIYNQADGTRVGAQLTNTSSAERAAAAGLISTDSKAAVSEGQKVTERMAAGVTCAAGTIPIWLGRCGLFLLLAIWQACGVVWDLKLK